ncbi:MAG: hypothetical protein ACKOX2_02140 [Microcystaceae cyanobacterium]
MALCLIPNRRSPLASRPWENLFLSLWVKIPPATFPPPGIWLAPASPTIWLLCTHK